MIAAIDALIGRTPLLELHAHLDGRPLRIYAKYEVLNLTGSVKDRMAAYIVRRATEQGELKPGHAIVEASSGNTGISFAAVGRALGHPVRIYMPNWMSQERVQLIQHFGAVVIPVSHEQGGFLGAISLAEAYAREHRDVYLPRQFDNPANIDAHFAATGPEIEQQLAAFGRQADGFIAGVGTGGTVMGVGRYLRRDGRRVRVHPLEPANSPTLRTGCKVGKHRIQGISDEFIPPIVDLTVVDKVIPVDDGDAILMAQKLAADIGLGVGISSGANFLGALEVQRRTGLGAAVVTVFPDSNKKYMSSGLLDYEPAKPGFVSPHVRLLGFRALNRVCGSCVSDEHNMPAGWPTGEVGDR